MRQLQPIVKADLVTLFKQVAIDGDCESSHMKAYQSQYDVSQANTPLLDAGQNEQLGTMTEHGGSFEQKKTPKFVARPRKHSTAKSLESSERYQTRISRQVSNNSDLDFVLPQHGLNEILPDNIDEVVRRMIDKVTEKSKIKVGITTP